MSWCTECKLPWCLLNHLSGSLPACEGLAGFVILVQDLPLHVVMSLVFKHVPYDSYKLDFENLHVSTLVWHHSMVGEGCSCQ